MHSLSELKRKHSVEISELLVKLLSMGIFALSIVPVQLSGRALIYASSY